MMAPSLFRIVEDGFLIILAIDHTKSLSRLIRPTKPRTISASRFFGVKNDIVKALSPFASATMLDLDGAKHCRQKQALAQRSSLLLTLERSGYSELSGERTTQLDRRTDALKAREFGADSVKLRLYYNPRYLNSAARQRKLLKHVRKKCLAARIPLMLELVVYEVPLDMREGAILGSARELSPFCDFISLQFPIYSVEEERAVDACRLISDSIRIPWVLMNNWTGFTQFKWELEMACKGGASGFSAGSALWKVAARLPAAERARFLNVISSGRLIRLRNVVRRHGTRVDDVY